MEDTFTPENQTISKIFKILVDKLKFIWYHINKLRIELNKPPQNQERMR